MGLQEGNGFRIGIVALFLATLVAISYWPVFLGRVPLPADQITQFPPFRPTHYEMSVRTPHAELGDTITEVYPWRKFAAESIRHGVIPLWNPLLLAGTPFQANSLSALLNPINFVFLVLPTPMAWSFSLMLKVFLAAMFTVLFLREAGVSVSGAIVGAITFAFGGFMTGWLAWPRADTAMWLPLICFQVHRLCRQPSRRNAIVLAAVLTLPIFAGHPGTIARVLATAAGYSLWIVVWQHSHGYRKQLAWLSVAGILSVGLAAVQIAPTIEWLGHIFRTLDMPGFPWDLWQAIGFFSRDLSKQPNSAGIFIPDAAVYAGALPLLAAAFAFFRRGQKDVLFFAIVFVISFCSAYGISPIIELAQKTPVFSGLRMDEALMLADFSIAILAAFGISYLETFKWKEVSKKEIAAAIGVLLIATAAWHQGAAILSRMTERGVEWWLSPRSFRVILVVSAFIIGLRLLQLLPRRLWIVLASVLIAADLVSAGYGHIPFNRRETIYPDVPLFRFLSQQQKPFRVVSLNAAAPLNVEYVYGLSTAGGYEYMLKRLSSLSEGVLEEPANGYLLSFTAKGIIAANNRIIDLLNIRYLVATKFNESDSMMRTHPARFHEVWSENNVSVFENRTVLPKAFLIPLKDAEVIPTEDAQLARLKDSNFDPEHRVILPARVEEQIGVEQQPDGPQEVVQYNEGTNSVRVQVKAATPSILVLSQMHYPGWRVYIDGKSAPLLRPDYAFTGTMVGEGTHDVQFRFLPTTFIVGAILSALSLLLATIGYVYNFPRIP